MLFYKDEFKQFCKETQEGFDKQQNFYQSLHQKLTGNGIKSGLTEYPQIGGGVACNVAIHSKGIRTYGYLGGNLVDYCFYGFPAREQQIPIQPNLNLIIEKIARPEIVNVVSRNAEAILVGTQYHTDYSYMHRDHKIPGIMGLMTYFDGERWLHVNYQFIQENSVERIKTVLTRKLNGIHSSKLRKLLKKISFM